MSRGLVPLVAALALAGCGGGNPLANPDDVANPEQVEGRHLSFVYYQACVDMVLTTPQGTATCAASGCHDSATGTGGALRLAAGAATLDASRPAAELRDSAMYRNFYSAQGMARIGDPAGSLLLAKPRLQNVLHGGGLVFSGESEATRRLAFWIARPMPTGQDEFSSAGNALLGPGGECRTE